MTLSTRVAAGLTGALACLAIVAPANAQVHSYQHHFPGIGPTGTSCRTLIVGSYGRTHCSRGLTDAEAAADRQQWNAKTSAALSRQGLPANYCTQIAQRAESARKQAHAIVFASMPSITYRSRNAGDKILCEGEIQRGANGYTPFFARAEARQIFNAQ